MQTITANKINFMSSSAIMFTCIMIRATCVLVR